MDPKPNSSFSLSVPHRRSYAWRVLVLISGLFLFSSCSSVGRYAPDPSSAKGVAGNLSFSNSVAVVNAQDSRELHSLDFRGIVVDYHEFTQSIVDALKAELGRNGVSVQDEASKTLRVAVRQVTMMPGPATYRGTIVAKVETGDGHAENFHATRASYASGWNVGTSPTKPLDAAFRDLINDILANKVFQDYLAN